MKTAISVPDTVFAEAERVARRLSKSRSQLYAEAVAEYVVRHDPDAVTEAMDQIVSQLDTAPDAFTSTCGQQVLGRSEW